MERNLKGQFAPGHKAISEPKWLRSARRVVQKKLADHAERAGEVMAELLDDEDSRVRLAAAQFVITKVDGKPTQPREHSGQVEHHHDPGEAYLAAMRSLARQARESRMAEVINLVPQQPQPAKQADRQKMTYAEATRVEKLSDR